MTTQVAVPMESAGEYPMRRNLKAVPVVFDSPTFTFRHNNIETSSHIPSNLALKENSDTASHSMSIAFREVFKNYSEEKQPVPVHVTKNDKILDSFSRGEQLLKSEDNVRPLSKAKTSATLREHNSRASEELLSSKTLHSSSSFHNHDVESRVNEICLNVRTPASTGEQKNVTNNAEEVLDKSQKSSKKGKKHKKRSNSVSMKVKRGKQGRVSLPATGTHFREGRESLTPSAFNTSNKHNRVSSEPASKISLSSILSYTLSGNAQKRLLATSARHKSDVVVPPLNLHADTSKTNIKSESLNKAQSLGTVSTVQNGTPDVSFKAQGAPLTLFKADLLPRVKSGHSVKSESRSVCSTAAKEDTTQLLELSLPSKDLSLSAKQCHIQNPKPAKNPPTHSNTHHHKSSKNNSSEPSSKEEVLTSIYGAVYQTANKLQAQVDDLKKVRKIFLSDKQSGTIRENGVDYPCAPPATPNPDLHSKYEYIPSMGDIRSQQAVKKRLQVMERDAHKKKEKQKEEKVKQEKQQVKDREKAIKAKQRREIYALNKIMTDLEYKRFLEFCQMKGLKM